MKRSPINVRVQAAKTLVHVLPASRAGTSLRPGLEAYRETDWDAADRGLVYDLCFGVCRHWRLLSTWVDSQLQKPLKPSAHQIKIVLCCGLYEIWFSRRPAHAIVNAWPDVCRKLRFAWAAGLTNAILRNACREDRNEWESKQPLRVRTSLPDWLADCWKIDWPNAFDSICAASLEPAPMSLRNNRLRQTTDQLQKTLELDGRKTRTSSISKYSLTLETAISIDLLPGFHEGLFSIQDEAAQLPAELIKLENPCGNILDACAAPGGKTGQLAEKFPQAAIDALDISPQRLQQVKSNLERLQLTAQTITGDLLNPNWWNEEKYDAILLDAPCSACGILRRQPDSKWHKHAKDLDELTATQQQMLQASWALLKPGGCLVYATCSILKRENEYNIEKFLGTHSDANETTPSLLHAVNTGPGCQLLPESGQWDGFYFARLEKQ